MNYALDSNAVIHLMRNTLSVWKNLEAAQKEGSMFCVPPFVNYEILRGLMIKPIRKHKEAYSMICNNCILGEMTVTAWKCVAKIYAELYVKRLTVSDSDIVIAAFCIVNNYTLVTDNTADFENIDGLQMVNWVE